MNTNLYEVKEFFFSHVTLFYLFCQVPFTVYPPVEETFCGAFICVYFALPTHGCVQFWKWSLEFLFGYVVADVHMEQYRSC